MEENNFNFNKIHNKQFNYTKFMNYDRYMYRIDLYNNKLRRFANDVIEAIYIIDKDMNLKNHLLNINDIEYFFNKNYIILDLMPYTIKKYIQNQQTTTLYWDKLIQREENYDLIYKQIQDIIKEMQIRLQSI